MGVNIGATAIAGAKIGTTTVNKIYLGSTEIWSDSPAPVVNLYGKLSYYSSWQFTYTIDNEESCTATITNFTTLESFFASSSSGSEIYFEYDEWMGGGTMAQAI